VPHVKIVQAWEFLPSQFKQIVAVTTLMRVAEDKRNFEQLFRRAFPKKNQQLELPYKREHEE